MCKFTSEIHTLFYTPLYLIYTLNKIIFASFLELFSYNILHQNVQHNPHSVHIIHY